MLRPGGFHGNRAGNSSLRRHQHGTGRVGSRRRFPPKKWGWQLQTPWHCNYRMQIPQPPWGTCPSPGHTEFTAHSAEMSGPPCRCWGRPDPPPHTCPRWGAEPQGEAFLPTPAAPWLGWGAQVFSSVPSDAPVARVAPLIHLTAAILHIRGERFLKSSSWTPFLLSGDG